MKIFVKKMIGYTLEELSAEARRKALKDAATHAAENDLKTLYRPLATQASLRLPSPLCFSYAEAIAALTEAEQDVENARGVAIDFANNDNAGNTPSTLDYLFRGVEMGGQLRAKDIVHQIENWCTEYKKLAEVDPRFLFSEDFLVSAISDAQANGAFFDVHGNLLNKPGDNWAEI